MATASEMSAGVERAKLLGRESAFREVLVLLEEGHSPEYLEWTVANRAAGARAEYELRLARLTDEALG